MCDLVFQQNVSTVFDVIQQDGQPLNQMTPQNFCIFIHDISQTLTKFLLHIMYIPVVTLILITLFGKEKNEDAKWFVFHTAILNLILGIAMEITYLYPDYMKIKAIQIIQHWSLGLAVESIFPLAFTRFFCLYFTDRYEKIFTKKTILLWLLAYDVAMLMHYLFATVVKFATVKNAYICLGISSALLIGTIIFSTLVVLKIRGMMKIVSNSKLSTYSDLRKAAFICLFQACVNSLYMISSIYMHVYADFFMDTSMNSYSSVSLNGQGAIQRILNPNGNSSSQTLGFEFPSQSSSLSMMNQTFPEAMPKSSHFLLFAYMLLDDWQYPLYQLYVILDTLITLIVLRTYRNALKTVFSCVMKTLKIRVYKPHDLSMYKKTTSVNQWTRVTKSTK